MGANLLGLLAFLWPFVVPAAAGSSGTGHEGDWPWIVAALLGILALLLFVELGRGGMGPKAVALVGVLGAAMVALRLPGFVAGFSPMFVIVLVAGSAFGPGFGFVQGAVGTFASGLFVGGLGPWLPFQMVAIGWVGMGAGLLTHTRSRRGRIWILAAYGAMVAFAFGAVINLWFWPFRAGSSALGWAPELGAPANLARYGTFYLATSAWWDAYGAVGNAVLVTVLGRPLLAALDRAARRMSFTTSSGRAGEGTEWVRDVNYSRPAPTRRPRWLSRREGP
ncbi:MAG: ECF transporter S component [Actinomycetota bacterium]|nr:ECF transporter S component [Actinomycetota bacterium]